MHFFRPFPPFLCNFPQFFFPPFHLVSLYLHFLYFSPAASRGKNVSVVKKESYDSLIKKSTFRHSFQALDPDQLFCHKSNINFFFLPGRLHCFCRYQSVRSSQSQSSCKWADVPAYPSGTGII